MKQNYFSSLKVNTSYREFDYQNKEQSAARQRDTGHAEDSTRAARPGRTQAVPQLPLCCQHMSRASGGRREQLLCLPCEGSVGAGLGTPLPITTPDNPLPDSHRTNHAYSHLPPLKQSPLCKAGDEWTGFSQLRGR